MRIAGLVLSVAASVVLSGCFFVFLPGALVQKVSDGITGDEGEHCVSRAAKVGDSIRLPGGGVGTVKSLSGTSVRCTQPELPIRAALEMR